MPTITAKDIYAFIILGAIVLAFFMDKLSAEYFIGIASSIITHYYKQAESDRLEKKLNNAEAELQSYKSKVEIVDLDNKNGKKEDISGIQTGSIHPKKQG